MRFLFSNSLKRQGKKQELKVAGQSFCEESLLWLNLDQWSLNEKIEHLCQEVKDIDQPELPPLIVTEQSIELEMPASLSLYFPNPLKVLLEENLPKPNQVRYGVIHGNIWANTMLANQNNQMWLIDFHHAGIGPLVWDYASVETTLKFELLNTISLPERLALEEILLAPTTLREAITTEGIELDSVLVGFPPTIL